MSNFRLKAKAQLRLFITAMISLCIVTGCEYHFIPSEVRKSLKLAGENKHELLSVINHYKKNDKEKLEAAYYLISNMPGHYSIGGQDVFDPAFEQIMPVVRENGITRKTGELFSNLIDSIQQVDKPLFTTYYDINTITKDILINNIDLAFKAYYSIPEDLRCDKPTFMRFILPYRNSNVPLEPFLRCYFFEKYYWIFERMVYYGSLERAVCDLLDSMNIRVNNSFKYPFVMPLTKTYKLGFCNGCSSMVNFTVYIFRSLGIPAANDYTPQFGNGTGSGHEWFVILTNEKEYAIDIPEKKMLDFLYKFEAIPKIYRKHFEINYDNLFNRFSLDVTENYRITSVLQVPTKNPVSLSVFDRSIGWIPVDSARKGKSGSFFQNIGRDIIYAIIEHTINGKVLFDNPFYLNNKGEFIPLLPDHSNKITAYITRKYPPYTLRTMYKLIWINSINGAILSASNEPDFSNATCFIEINNFSSFNKQIIKTNNKNKYRYYRLTSSDSSRIHISCFELIKDNEKIDTDLEVTYTAKNIVSKTSAAHLKDDNPLTFVNNNYFNATYSFSNPINISEFQIQVRNDNNNVRPGCLYELMYWDNGWTSAGIKIADDTLLIYEDLPSGTFFWLRNHTEGREEQVFLLDSDGYQYWPGVTPYLDFYHEFMELETLCDPKL